MASAAIEKLLKNNTSFSFYRIYVLANRYGIGFHLRAIPEDYALTFDSLSFNPVDMTRLFELGQELGENSGDWASAPPGLDPDERIQGPERPRRLAIAEAWPRVSTIRDSQRGSRRRDIWVSGYHAHGRRRTSLGQQIGNVFRT
jgi:hypothetical protein